MVCVPSANALVLPPDVAAGGLPYSSWRAAPEAGDIVAVFDTAGAGRWRTAVVDSAGTRADGAGCKPSSGLMSPADSAARRAVTRVVFHAVSDPIVAVAGAPVRVLRGGRYALTRSTDGSWSLSYRRCTGSACGSAQPVVGPLAAPGDSGLVFTDVPGESRIEVALRPLAPAPPARGEPGLLRVTLRNRAAGSP